MSALWGTPAQRTRVLFVSAALIVLLTGCEYTGPNERVQPSPQASTQPPRALLNSDPRASELEDMREWASQQLQPALPGQLAGYASSKSPSGYGMTAKPGSYELHFLCEGGPDVELSVTSWRGAEVLAPVRVPCDGGVFSAPVKLATEGADLSMKPGGGAEGRYAFRLIPAA